MNLHDFFRDKIILVAGGTGSIGSEIVNQLLKYDPRTIRILSNNENELWKTKNIIQNIDKLDKTRFLLGDIRNYERVKRAMIDVDYVFNAAAIKHVPISEYNPMQAVNVNIHGLENLIGASYEFNVKKMIHISTDKAINPSTVMGATKMIGERLCISRNKAKGSFPLKISCVRFGNVLGSRGSIIPLIKYQIQNGNEVTLTSDRMMRFFMSIEDAVDLVLKSVLYAEGGEIFVLKMPTIRIKDLIEVIVENYAPKLNKNPNQIKIKLIGPRPGEKLDEDLISPIEYDDCRELADMYVITNSKNSNIGNKISQEHLKMGYISTKFTEPLSKSEIEKTLKKLNLI